MTWINPYKARIDQFPSRLFPFEDFDKDCKQVRDALVTERVLYCEIGSGSGKHAIELASQHPKAQVFGFEIRYKRAVRTIEKAQQQNISNVYVLRTKGEHIQEIFPANSIDGLFVHFPDPWAKGRWHKHRILAPTFLDMVPVVLKSDGFLQVKTDHKEYFTSFLRELEQDARFVVAESTENLYESQYLENNIASEFECLFTGKNVPICYARVLLANDVDRSTSS